MTTRRYCLALLAALLLSGVSAGIIAAEPMLTKWMGQTVYVPLYSHIYADERYKNKPFNLTATLSIRNTDMDTPIRLQAVDYYDSGGTKLRGYLDSPVTLPPLASVRYIVRETDTTGGSGAKFLVTWEAEPGVTEPIVESIMIGTKLQQGISFVSRGKVIKGKKVER